MLLCAERLTVFLTSTSAPELGLHAIVGLFGGFVGVALVAALGAAGTAAISQRFHREYLVAFTLACVLGALGGLTIGYELGDGGWVSRQSWSWLLRFLPAAIGTVVGPLTYLAIIGVAPRRARLSAGFAAAAIVGAVGLVVLDHQILLGTYPDVHLLLLGFAAAGASVGLYRLLPRPGEGKPAVLYMVATVAAAAMPLFWFTMPMLPRAELTFGSPMAVAPIDRTLQPVQIDLDARELAELDAHEGAFVEPVPARPRLDRTDWNVLWITVDTLRHDAVWPIGPPENVAWAKPGDTPRLDAWLQKTVVFEHAYAQSSATDRSMPPMFRSLEAHQDTLKLGSPLGELAARTGRTSAAVVNNFFLEPRMKRTQSLLWGFQLAEIYHKTQQEQLVEMLDTVVERTRDHGFFVWLHFYNMHSPGYGESGMLEKGSWPTRYRTSLKWLDARFDEVLSVLEKQGVADDTIVVFSSDHGEGLGDNRIKNHGPTVYEEEVRVPLAIYVPGVQPRVVEETVGNIDILPTLWEAIGETPSVTFRGRSLLGTVVGEPLPARPYYIRNWNAKTTGVVVEDMKLIRKKKSGTLLRFDVEADPTEDDNLYTDSDEDRQMLAQLYRSNPGLVEATPVMGVFASSKLAKVDPDEPGAALHYLIDIAERSRVDEANRPLADLVEESTSLKVKMAALRGLFRLNTEQGTELALDELRKIDRAEEAEFVRGLHDIRLQPVDIAFIIGRFSSPADVDSRTTAAYLRWLTEWNKPAVGSLLAIIASHAGQREPAYAAEVLAAFARLLPTAELSEAQKREVLELNRTLLTHPDPLVRSEAIEAAGALKDKDALPTVRAQLAGDSVRDRQAALYALARIEGEHAVDAIVTAGETDPLLVLDAVKALKVTKSAKALPFLEDTAENHYNWIIQDHAKTAIKQIKKANGLDKKSKPSKQGTSKQ